MDLDHLMIGAGDIWSTTHDLRTWDAALEVPGRILSNRSLEEMFSPQVPIPVRDPAGTTATGSVGNQPSYGYGWYREVTSGRVVFYHTGDNPGFRAFNARLPSVDTIIVLLANDERSDTGAIGERLAMELFEGTSNRG